MTVENLISKIQMEEYEIMMLIREAYFKEHKKYLSLAALSGELASVDALTSHFRGDRNPFFKPFLIFTIEQWCKKNLPGHFIKIQRKIDDWRVNNDDTTVYAIQNTPFRMIVYDLLLLHYQQKDEILNIRTLDQILSNEKGFPAEFIGKKILPSYSSTVSMPSLLLLKGFVKKNYDGRTREAKQLIKDIDDYIKISRDYSRSGSHSEEFSRIKPFQLKHLIDITKGLDVMRGQFFTEDELYLIATEGGVVRHHIGEDSLYDYILYVYKDEGTIKYLVKLVPLGFLSSHQDIHNSLHSFTGMANDVIEARTRHLFELDQMEFDSTIPEDEVENYYFEIFRTEFRSRKNYIGHFNSEKNIWGAFEGGKVDEMTDKMIRKYVKRWIESKEVSEQTWYINNHYERFYKEKYLPFMKNIYAYMRDRSHDTSMLKTHVCKWFIETYLRDEPLFDFYDKPLDSFINNI